MSLLNDHGKDLGYAGRNFGKYEKFVDYDIIKDQLKLGYKELHENSGNKFVTADVLPFPSEGEKTQ